MRLGGPADRVDGAEGVAEAGLRAGLPRDHRQTAGVVEEVEPELRAVVQVREIDLQVEAVLAGVRRRVVGQAIHRLEVGVQPAAQRAEVDAEVGDRAEPEEDALAARGAEVVGAEVGAGRLRHRLVPVEQVQELAAQVLGELQVEDGHLIRQQRLAQLRARHPQRRDVEVVRPG